MQCNKILSVSVAAYNAEKTLRQTLDAFAASGVLEALDIMVVDDGSKDSTPAIAKEYAKKYPDSFRQISKENGGWGSTVNTGIDNAVGRYFRLVDGDDYCDPESMPEYIEVLRNCEADLVVTPYISFKDATGELLSYVDCNPGYETAVAYRLDALKGFGPSMHSIAVRTDRIKDKFRITEHCFYTDTEFVLKACNQVSTVMFLDMSIYCYRRASAGQSMSLPGMEKHYNEQTIIIKELLTYMKEQVSRPEVKAVYDELLFTTCIWQYLVMLYIKPTAQHKKDIKAYDRMLSDMAPDYYDRVDSRMIHILRKTGFVGYSILARCKRWKDHRFTKDGRMLW